MGSDVPTVRGVVQAAARRAMIGGIVRRAGQGGAAGSGAGLLAVAVSRLVDIPIAWWWLGAAPVGAGLLWGCWTAWRERPSPADAARRLDDFHATKDRILSALELEAAPGGSFEALARTDGAAVAARADPRGAIPIRAGRTWALAGGLALLVVTVGLYLPRADVARWQWRRGREVRSTREAIAEVRQAVASLKQVQPGPLPSGAATPDQLRALEDIEAQLASGKVDPQAARTRAAEALEDSARRLEQEMDRRREELAGAREALARAVRRADAPGTASGPFDQVSRSLGAGDLESAAREVSDLASRAPRMDVRERQELARDLAALARDMESQDRAARAGRPMESGAAPDEGAAAPGEQYTPHELARSLRQAEREMRAPPPQGSDESAKQRPISPPGGASPEEASRQPGRAEDQAEKQPSSADRSDQGKPGERSEPERPGTPSRAPSQPPQARESGEPEHAPRAGETPSRPEPRSSPGPGAAANPDGTPSGSFPKDKPSRDGTSEPTPQAPHPMPDTQPRATPQGETSPSPQPSPEGGPRPGEGATPRNEPNSQPQAQPGASPQPGAPQTSPKQQRSDGQDANPDPKSHQQAQPGPRPAAPPGQPQRTASGPGTHPTPDPQQRQNPDPETTPQAQQPAAGDASPRDAKPAPSAPQPGQRKEGTEQRPTSVQGSPQPRSQDPAEDPSNSRAQGERRDETTGPQASPRGSVPDVRQQPGDQRGAPGQKNTPAKSHDERGAASPMERPSGPSADARPDDSPPDMPPSDSRKTEPGQTETGPSVPPGSQGLDRLARQLQDMASKAAQSRDARRQAEQLREQAQRLMENASPEDRQRLNELAQRLGGSDGRGNQGPRTGSTPHSTEPWGTPGGSMDARATSAAPERTIGELEPIGEAPRGAGPGALVQGIRDAAAGAERAVEQQGVPQRHADLVKRVFGKYTRHVEHPAEPKP